MGGPSASRCSSSSYSRLALSEPEPPAVVVDHDGDVVGVVEGRGAALEGRVVEVPLRRGGLPDELGEVAAVLLVAGPAALGGEVVLVPPLKLGGGRQRHLAGVLASDQVAAHRDQARASFGPERRDDARCAGAPVEARDDRLVDRRARPSTRSRPRRAPPARRCEGSRSARKRVVPIAAQVRDDHAVALRGQQRGDLGVAVDVVGPAVQQDGDGPVGGPDVGVADVQNAGIDLLDGAERRSLDGCSAVARSTASAATGRSPASPRRRPRAAPRRRSGRPRQPVVVDEVRIRLLRPALAAPDRSRRGTRSPPTGSSTPLMSKKASLLSQ